MDSKRIEQQMRFLAEIDQMKAVYRQTLLIDRSRTETDAEHSWHLAMMAMTLFEYCKDPSVDLLRVLQMVLVHDLVEIYAGDTFAYDAEGTGRRPSGRKKRRIACLPCCRRNRALPIGRYGKSLTAYRRRTPDLLRRWIVCSPSLITT